MIGSFSLISGTLIQVFDAENEREIHRVLVSGDGADQVERYSIRSGSETVHDAIFTLLEAGTDADGYVLSINLPARVRTYSLYWDDRKAAKIRKTDRILKIVQRDLRMINPSIDDAYRTTIQIAPDALAPIHASTQPLMSIVSPLYNTPARYLAEMIDSVRAQTYSNWELVLVNSSPDNQEMHSILASLSDPRIRTVSLSNNLGIVGNTNFGIAQCRGDYIAFLDHDDTLHPEALAEYAGYIDRHPDADLFYCDEDNFSESDEGYYSPRYKADFNLDLLYSHNYVVHFLMVSKWVLKKVNLSDDRHNGAQDYDLTLKAAEHARDICHIPRVLYHWREHAGSTNGGVMDSKPYAIEAGAEALRDHFDRRGLVASVEPSTIPCVYRTIFAVGKLDMSLIVIFSSLENAKKTIAAFTKTSSATPQQIIAVGIGSERLSDALARVTAVTWDEPYSFSRMVDAAMKLVTSRAVLVCTDRVTFAQPECAEVLLGTLNRPEVSIVSPRLFYPDGLIQHAGIVLLPDGTPIFVDQNFRKGMGGGYMGLAECTYDCSAVSPDCFMIRRSDWTVPAEMHYRLNNPLLEMVNICLELRSAGKLVVATALANAICNAPVVINPTDALDSYGENTLASFAKRWSASELRDVIYNQNVDYTSGYPQLRTSRNIDVETIRVLKQKIINKVLTR